MARSARELFEEAMSLDPQERALSGLMRELVLVDQVMPPSDAVPLSDCELQQIDTWLLAGSLEN